jgi:hypothetical protein
LQVVIQIINALHLLALEASGNRAGGFLPATYTRYYYPPFSISIFRLLLCFQSANHACDKKLETLLFLVIYQKN